MQGSVAMLVGKVHFWAGPQQLPRKEDAIIINTDVEHVKALPASATPPNGAEQTQ